MKKTVAISLAILMLFSLFQGALRGSVVKAADYQWVPVNECFPAAYVTDLCIDHLIRRLFMLRQKVEVFIKLLTVALHGFKLTMV